MTRRWLLSLLAGAALALGPSVVRAQTVPWNTSAITGTVVSANAASVTVRDDQGFLHQIAVTGPRPALAKGMRVRATGSSDGLGLQAMRIDTGPLVPAIPSGPSAVPVFVPAGALPPPLH